MLNFLFKSPNYSITSVDGEVYISIPKKKLKRFLPSMLDTKDNNDSNFGKIKLNQNLTSNIDINSYDNMATSIFAQLPDDILKHIGEYWSDYKESIYRRIMKVTDCESQRAVVRWKNPKTALIKMTTLKLPQVLVSVNVSDINNGDKRFIMPNIKITKCMCVITSFIPRLNGGFFPRTKQFNFVKKTDEEYNKFLAKELFWEWHNVKVAWEAILKKQYPAMYALVRADISEESRFYYKEHHNYPSLTYHQLMELKRNFGTDLPKHITSL